MTRPISECRLYLCTPDRPDLFKFVEATINGGVDMVQLRDKVLDAKHLLARASELQKLCTSLDVPFILNDRPDLALEVGADGVHVGQDDAPVSLARRLLGRDAIIGLSTHRPRTWTTPCSRTPLTFRPALSRPRPTKPGRPGTGLDYLRLAIERSTVPVFVTGGVTPERIPALAEAGARHFVVVRYLTESTAPEAAARRLRHAIS